MKFIVPVLFCFCFTLGFGSVVVRDVPTPKREECYDHYGCFSTDNPWTSTLRPNADLPNPPWEVGTRFLLFTRSNIYDDFELVPDNDVILGYSPFDSTKKTVFLVHGFTDNHLTPWMVEAKNALLEKEDINVISVDWAPGASRSYLKATNNARMVGAQLTRLLKFLVASADLELAALRIVGHSIGAHVAGYAGYDFWGEIGYITALDPVEQYFGGTEEIVRLDSYDALHVHVIHTNGDSLFGMGINGALGRVDLFPNGGNSQPGCSDLLEALIGTIANLIFWDFEGAIAPWVCSHVRAVDYYVESIKSLCPFVAHKCDSYSDFNNGRCHTSCTVGSSCTVLGYGSENNTLANGKYYLNTDEDKNYCMQSVQFDTTAASNQDRTDGTVTVEFRYGGENSKKFTIVDGNISGGQILSKWLDLPSKVMSSSAEKPTLYVHYERNGLVPILNPRYLSLDPIIIFVLNEELNLEQINYPAVTLDAGEDSIIYPL